MVLALAIFLQVYGVRLLPYIRLKFQNVLDISNVKTKAIKFLENVEKSHYDLESGLKKVLDTRHKLKYRIS